MKIPARTFSLSILIVAFTVLPVHRPSPRPSPKPRSLHQSRRQPVLYRVPTKEKMVALTFDDGPDPAITPKILRSLDRYKVKATFFMVGKRMERYPEVVKAVIARGHVIGDHTYTHPDDIRAAAPDEIAREIQHCGQVIERMTGQRPRLFRPPSGLVNGTVLTIAEDEGYRTILWSVSADHHDAPTPWSMLKRVKKYISPGGIILMHDGFGRIRRKDVRATPLIIRALLKRGYRFVTVPELLSKSSERSRFTAGRIGGGMSR